MRTGLTIAAARSSLALRAAPAVQRDGPHDDQDDREEAEAVAVLRVVRELLQRVQLLPEKRLSRRAILILFDEDDKTGGDLSARRVEVAHIENLSQSTVRRRQGDLAIELRRLLMETDKDTAIGAAAHAGSLTGTWYAIWQTTAGGAENINTETIRAGHDGRRLTIENDAIAEENPIGGYLWRGSLRVEDRRTLMGTYAARDGGSAQGTLFYIVNPTGRFMEGRWVGTNVDEDIASGVTVMARDPELARARFDRLRTRSNGGPS